jgi:hypothetical protein
MEPEDFEFYKKIQVPAPTWCPDCRAQRRLAYYVDLLRPKLYKRKCDATGKDIISIYKEKTSFPVYHRDYWNSDVWDPLVYGKDYDFSKPFFQQFYELQLQVPRYHTYSINSTNSDYCAAITNSKDCYLSCGMENQNAYFSAPLQSKEVCDSWIITKCELVYETVNSDSCYKVYFSEYANGCSDSAFLYDCTNCSNCFGCVGLKNKSFCIFNKQYSKEAYEKEISKYNLGSYSGLQRAKQDFEAFKISQPHRFAYIFNSENCSGNNIRDSKNTVKSFDILAAEDSKYCAVVAYKIHDCYDSYDSSGSTLGYENVATGGNTFNVQFSYLTVYDLRDIEYSDSCKNSDNLFGCVGLRKKSYCILNKQYTKEEYETLLPKIKQHMKDMPYTDRLGRTYSYGEFFPSELALTSYDQNVAQEYWPLKKDDILARGFAYQPEPENELLTTLAAKNLPDNIKEVEDGIVKENIEDENGHKFRYIKKEIELYRKMNIALPRFCPMCRFSARRRKQLPMKLWTRACSCIGSTSGNNQYKNAQQHFHGTSKCPNTFETAFAPDRPEIVYCKQCFEKELN